MSDPLTSRGSAAANRAAGRRNAGGPPLKTKAEKRAEAKAAKARAQAMRRRRRALAVGGAAVGVVAVVVGLAVWIGTVLAQPDPPAADGAATPGAATPSAAAPSTGAAFPPVPAGADPALSRKPAATAGAGAVTELKATNLIEGTGAAAQAGQTITVNYVGVTYADGQEFDSSWSRSEPFSFQLGAGNVIQGWDQGLAGAKVGSRVQLDIPAALAYGDNPTGGQPAGALRFIVDVLSAT
ncbi:FKBP-type peptidyl-prolyl cis-trans isomerase [Catenuloplanes atrovinosus]|uniref:Peptidyl-prolyl cis-trans isomerase n=1 Tax=Catenuloplanes atrovinosus TaxID=137266 RepID=A0AAE3YPT5_9ACTN|nr:FKBP-type peptidyl-prolyl cis-trans isomerase [Catenuloplanes atrovinosus]MDR7276361.1 peptidylprolyl isomerase [Catenuloplanes atrovinosus]